ncbi:hypothetical protein D0863_02588 [Hortaea werneckii]|uniref:Nucleoporin NUP37 n=1 Tax=Hortaea werneckii TaxID=91943 RepID=A0A3M7EFT0_HORWE|nr:hypothetical protein D0863_02588 [Hortaea werneckii]
MEPKVTRGDRKLHLSYEVPHRIHDAHIYPITAPNGSTVAIYGHESGIRILWRGGRRRQDRDNHRFGQTSNTRSGNQDVIVIDDDEDMQEPASVADASYEDGEEEQDSDCPYQSILQMVEVDIGTEVLHLTVPVMPSALPSARNKTMRSHGLVVAGCADGQQRVLRFSLAPPTDSEKQTTAEQIARNEIILPPSDALCNGVAATIVPSEAVDSRGESDASNFLMVAVITKKLSIYQFAIFNDLAALSPDVEEKLVSLPHAALGVAFHPSQRLAHLLISDASGAIRIYDPLSPTLASARPSSSGSEPDQPPSTSFGRWISTFHTSFAGGPSGLAKRKHLLDAKWIMGGKAVLVLLDDGEWGIWDVSGSSQTSKNIEAFVLNGFLGTYSVSESAEPTKQRRGQSKLAPMTPNTRKAKAEALFSGPTKVPGVAAKGGISVSASNSRTGQVDESVVMWYNGDVYAIPSLQQFWQRSTNSGGGFGSLYSPGLTHVTDINLRNEEITSISQFDSTSNSFGQMNTQRDLLVSAEHRFIVLQTLRPSTPSRMLFQQVAERPASRDQRMLDAGELDLGGMDRMLDNMANGDARPRRVGFAAL